MIISLTGPAGSGKSSIATMLAQRLNFDYYSMGNMRRKMALDRGITIEELNKLGESEAFTDKEVDDYQAELGKTKDNFVIEGRLGWHFIPNSIKFYVDADFDVRVKRVFDAAREDETYESIEQAKHDIKEREDSDVRRYEKYYGVNHFDKSHYDHIIDNTNMNAEETVEEILRVLKETYSLNLSA